MIIETLTWGTLDINEEQVHYFTKGIPGFEEETEFALITVEQGPFSCLQSLNNHELSFLLCDPFIFYPSYEFELPDNDKEELSIEDNVKVQCMVTIREELEQCTVNLLAPIVINPTKHLGKQIVLHKSSYGTKHTLWNTSYLEAKKGGE